MANVILPHRFYLRKKELNKSYLPQKQEVSMIRISVVMIDLVTPRQRLKTPFRFKWLKFKTKFFGLVLQKGVIL